MKIGESTLGSGTITRVGSPRPSEVFFYKTWGGEIPSTQTCSWSHLPQASRHKVRVIWPTRLGWSEKMSYLSFQCLLRFPRNSHPVTQVKVRSFSTKVDIWATFFNFVTGENLVPSQAAPLVRFAGFHVTNFQASVSRVILFPPGFFGVLYYLDDDNPSKLLLSLMSIYLPQRVLPVITGL